MASLNRIPLYDATLREVLLRVAYQCVRRDWGYAARDDWSDPARWVLQRALHYQAAGLPVIALQLAQFVTAIEEGYTLSNFIAVRCAEARRGALDERRRLLPSYKANRRVTPRVTNRGCHPYRDVWSDEQNNATLPDDLARSSDGD